MSGRRNLAGVVVVMVLGLFFCTSTALKVTFCEWEEVILHCSPGLTLKINTATYGRDNPYLCCTWDWPVYTAKCTKSVTTILKPKCDGKAMCKFSVSNTVFGSDPCPNVYKYVTIDYTCVGGVTIRPTIIAGVKRVVACEHRPLQMTCPAGQRVYVVKAEYGRGDSTTCLVGTLYQTNCLRDVKAAVAASCVNQQTCVVMAETAIAGNVDPCPGTYKYLVVEYRCV